MSEQKNPEGSGGPDGENGQDGQEEAVPAQREDTGEVIGTRRGMFGADNGGDTSGYGGLVRTVRLPGESSRPYGGPGGQGAPPRVGEATESSTRSPTNWRAPSTNRAWSPGTSSRRPSSTARS